MLQTSDKKIYRAQYSLLISIILMDLLAGMEFDLFVPSFPEIQQQFYLVMLSDCHAWMGHEREALQ